jgi:hypothetical protein
MAVYYLDTSALVKRYAQEVGTNWILNLTDRVAGHDLYTVRITGPEIIAALFRKVRVGEISQGDAGLFVTNFRLDWQHQYQILEIGPEISDLAMELAEEHGLRGYDAVHLASALRLQEVRSTLGLATLTFISADKDQLQIAVTEGLLVENPNNYP